MTWRIAILRHDHPCLHWDLLLEEGASCRCWRLLREPCCGEPIAAEPLPAHRLLYLDYEGPVSGNRGHVRRVFSGRYSMGDSSTGDFSIDFVHNGEFASASLRILKDDRQFWTFDAV